LDLLGNIAKKDGHELDDLFEFLGLSGKSSHESEGETLGINLFSGTDILLCNAEKALNEFAHAVQTSGFAERMSVVRNGVEFDLKVKGCKLNRGYYVHKKLDPTDVICPWGLIGMLIFEKKTGCIVHPVNSVYTIDGSSTKIVMNEL
jgi:hypothetical protein